MDEPKSLNVSLQLFIFFQINVILYFLQSPWGMTTTVPPAMSTCSLADVMSEQLARQLEEENHNFSSLAE